MNLRRLLSMTALMIGTVFLSIGVQVSAFSQPASAPPTSDAYAPLNTGPNTQTKTGGLILGTGLPLYALQTLSSVSIRSGGLLVGNSGPTTAVPTGNAYVANNMGVGVGVIPFETTSAVKGLFQVGSANPTTSGADGQIILGKNNGSTRGQAFKIGFDPTNSSLGIGPNNQNTWTSVLNITTDGRVGIGTTQPTNTRIDVRPINGSPLFNGINVGDRSPVGFGGSFVSSWTGSPVGRPFAATAGGESLFWSGSEGHGYFKNAVWIGAPEPTPDQITNVDPQVKLTVTGKVLADDYCLRSDPTKCVKAGNISTSSGGGNIDFAAAGQEITITPMNDGTLQVARPAGITGTPKAAILNFSHDDNLCNDSVVRLYKGFTDLGNILSRVKDGDVDFGGGFAIVPLSPTGYFGYREAWKKTDYCSVKVRTIGFIY